MKYLLIFLPIFSFAQGGDSTLYSVRIYDSYEGTHYLKIKGDSVFRFAKEPIWTPCDQHITEESSVMNRDKIEPCKVKILVWTGCSLVEMDAVRFCGYNYEGITDGLAPIKDYIVSYRSDGKWIKSSYVIKEL